MIHPPFKAPSLETMDTLLPAFEFIALIAADETGAVFLSNQRSLGRDVAIKVLAPHVSEDSATLARFENTCRSMAQLNHPNLVGIYNSGCVEGMLYFVMEFVPGKSLAHSTKGQSVDSKQALLIIEGICAGLIHAHQYQIIHGDLNLRNVLLNKKAEPKVTNFGLTYHHGKVAGPSIISSRFIAPEVLRNSSPSSPRSDIFSLGAILYELLTGQPHRSDAPPPSMLSDCGTKIDTIWYQATLADPEERTPDAATLLAALNSASDFQKNKARNLTAAVTLRAPLQPASPNIKVSNLTAAVTLRAPLQPASPNTKARNLTAAVTLRAPLQPASPNIIPKTPAATVAIKSNLQLQPASPNNQKLAITPKSTALSSSKNTPLPTLQVGFNWKLVRNLGIIAALLYAISLAWDLHKKTAEKQKNAALQTPAILRKPNPGSNPPRATTPSTHPPIDPSENPAPPKPTASATPDSPTESLARLRDALAAGKRDEMPVGTIRRGPHDYFVVSQPMSWPDATWFAEQHGGHLAIPSTTAPLTWLIEQQTAGDGIWLGVARNGLNTWALADGSAWLPKKQPSGVGQYLSADKHGFLKAENAKITRPFMIQWHTNGSNPGALATLLTSTRSSLTQPNPKFPPGTRTYGVRHYFFASRPLSWRNAADLAEASGGHLAVPSSIAEISNIEEMTKDLDVKNGIWLGASLTKNQWQWITGEPWKAPKWADGTNTTLPDSAMIIHPGNGWQAQNIAAQASGFIIEWSKDRK